MLDISQPLTTTASINGVDYDIDMSFGNVVRFQQLLEEDKYSNVQKVAISMTMFFSQRVYDEEFKRKLNIDEQFSIIKEISNTLFNHESKKQTATDRKGRDISSDDLERLKRKHRERLGLDAEAESEEKKTWDIIKDGGYIYSSFIQAYGIDLFEVQDTLHWHKFEQLLSDLPEDTKFKKVVDIRTMEVPSGAKEQKRAEAIRNAKRKYAL